MNMTTEHRSLTPAWSHRWMNQFGRCLEIHVVFKKLILSHKFKQLITFAWKLSLLKVEHILFFLPCLSLHLSICLLYWFSTSRFCHLFCVMGTRLRSSHLYQWKNTCTQVSTSKCQAESGNHVEHHIRDINMSTMKAIFHKTLWFLTL